MLAATACVLMLATTSGCDLVNTETPAQIAARAIDDAISQITNSSNQWQSVLQDTVAKLTDSAQSTVRVEVQNLLDRTVAVTFTQLQCGLVDFLGKRVLEHLEGIKAHILGQPLPPRRPTFCQPVPSSVDVNLVAVGRPDHVDFFGYDFDSNPAITVSLIETGKNPTDVTSKLITNTAFQLTIPFGANGVQLGPHSTAINLSWSGGSGGVLGSIAVIQPSIPLCIESSVPSRTFDTITDFIPPLIAGDADFWQVGNWLSGPSPLVGSVTVTPAVTQDAVTATIAMRVEEMENDIPHTVIAGSKANVLYRPPVGGRIEAIVFGGSALSWSTPVTGKVFGDSSLTISNAPDVVVKSMDIGGFTGGPIKAPGNRGSDWVHAGGVTAGVEVTWNEMTVKVLQPPAGFTSCT